MGVVGGVAVFKMGNVRLRLRARFANFVPLVFIFTLLYSSIVQFVPPDARQDSLNLPWSACTRVLVGTAMFCRGK